MATEANDLTRVVGIAGHAEEARGGGGRASEGVREDEEAGLIQGRREEEGREDQGGGREWVRTTGHTCSVRMALQAMHRRRYDALLMLQKRHATL